MSTFYGQVLGQAETLATRRGSEKSRIRSSVQSYDGSIITELYYDKQGELCITVEHASGSSFHGYTCYDGKFEHFIEDCRAARQRRA